MKSGQPDNATRKKPALHAAPTAQSETGGQRSRIVAKRLQVLAVDPGPTVSSAVMLDASGKVLVAFEKPNRELVDWLASLRPSEVMQPTVAAVEMVASYGMAVGAEVFETCVWIGRFWAAMEPRFSSVLLVPRLRVKQHLCHDSRAKDANIRQAILDRFGGKEAAIGNKAAPGPLYGIKSHLWAALALALTVQDGALNAVHDGGAA